MNFVSRLLVGQTTCSTVSIVFAQSLCTEAAIYSGGGGKRCGRGCQLAAALLSYLMRSLNRQTALCLSSNRDINAGKGSQVGITFVSL